MGCLWISHDNRDFRVWILHRSPGLYPSQVSQLQVIRRRGWEILQLSSDAVTIDIVPGLGGTIISLRRISDQSETLFTTPWGLRHRDAAPLAPMESSTIASSPGGWSSVFPDGSDLAGEHDEDAVGEARVCWLDWEFDDSAVVLTGRLTRTPFEFTRVISVLGDTVTIAETVVNVGGERIEVIWGSQLNLGGDLLGSDTVVDSRAGVVHPDPLLAGGTDYDDLTPWPRAHGLDSMINLRSIPAANAAESRLAYLSDFSTPGVIVRRPSLGLSIDLQWDGDLWPFAWYCVEAGRREDFPWFRKGYFLSLTPCSSWPAHGVDEARRVSDTTVWIGPSGSRTATVTVRVGS